MVQEQVMNGIVVSTDSVPDQEMDDDSEPVDIGKSTVEVYKFAVQGEWLRQVVNVNTMGTLNVTSVIFPLMASRKFGHVVNISSVCVSWFGLVVMIAIMDIL